MHQRKERRGTNKDATTATYEITDAQTNKQIQQSLERSVGKLQGGLKLVLLARNLAFNADAVQNYKYIFGPHRGPLSRLWNIKVTYNTKLWWNKAKDSMAIWSLNIRQPQTGRR